MTETNKKPQLMKYSAMYTRDLYRAIALNDEFRLSTIRTAIKVNEGEIGNADFRDLDIHDGAPFCPRHRLNINKDHWNATAADLDKNHDWDADGVWLPAEAAK